MLKVETQLYLNKQTECYEKLICLNAKPTGKLGTITKQIPKTSLSKFEQANISNCGCRINHCLNVVINPETKKAFCIDELTEFINLISEYGYSINTQLSKLIVKNPNTNHSDNFLFYIYKK